MEDLREDVKLEVREAEPSNCMRKVPCLCCASCTSTLMWTAPPCPLDGPQCVQELGYKREMFRGLSFWQSFGIVRTAAPPPHHTLLSVKRGID